MPTSPESFLFSDRFAQGVRGKRVLISGSGKEGGLGQAFAFAAARNGAASVGVHFHSSAQEGHDTVARIVAAGGNAFPVQADVTNTSDMWASRSYIIRKMGGPPELVICNSGLAERGYLLGRPLKAIDGEPPALRRSRARQAFVDNLADSSTVIHTKIDGFLNMTHLWAGEALNVNQPVQFVYISSRQAIDPGAGVPGYVLANFGVIALPRILRVNLGKQAGLVSAFSVAYPFVRTGMTEAHAEEPKVFGRWQSRMLSTREAAMALFDLLGRPREELDDRVFQLELLGPADDLRALWSEVALRPERTGLAWSEAAPLAFGGGDAPAA